EDGIRDKLVTGVQTCALPISNSFDAVGVTNPTNVFANVGSYTVVMRVNYVLTNGASGSILRVKQDFIRVVSVAPKLALGRAYRRSEERRVGKECSVRWSSYQL